MISPSLMPSTSRSSNPSDSEMVKAMSITAANRADAMAVLKYYITNTSPQELYSRIFTAFASPMLLSLVVENLLFALEDIGVITSSAHVAVNDNVNRSVCAVTSLIGNVITVSVPALFPTASYESLPERTRELKHG